MVVFSCYATLSYVISLRGNEGFLLDLDGMSRHTSGNQRRNKRKITPCTLCQHHLQRH